MVERHGASVLETDGGSYTCLQFASEFGHSDVVRWLISLGSNVHASTFSGRSSLWLAARDGKTEVCKILIDHGADLYGRSGIQESPLDMASKFMTFSYQCEPRPGAQEAAQRWQGETAGGLKAFLVDYCCQSWGGSTIHWAVYQASNNLTLHPNFKLIIQQLIDAPKEALEAKVTNHVRDGWTPLHYACYLNRYEAARVLLIRGVSVNARTDRDKLSPLDMARQNGHTEIVKLLDAYVNKKVMRLIYNRLFFRKATNVSVYSAVSHLAPFPREAGQMFEMFQKHFA
jgi:ankyrin repeat protein